MIVVLDASAAARVTLDPGQAPEFREPIANADAVIAPELIVAELANTFWKYFRTGVLSRDASEQALQASLELVDELIELEPLSAEAFDLAVLNERPAYDMFYLALARRNAAVLLTADATLLRTARKLSIRTYQDSAQS